MKKKKSMLSIIILSLLIALLPVYPAKASSAPSNVKGIDVSGKYNGTVDWESVAAQGYTFAMIRIAEGQAPDVDSQFEANYQGAKDAGLKVGVYHDCCIRTPEDALLEAAYCIELLDGRDLDYPVAYDIEKPGSFAGGIDNTTALAKAYCDAIEEAGYVPMIYSSAAHLNEEFNWEELEGIKVWAAHYTDNGPAFNGTYDLWQYSNTESVEGANTDKGHCDTNYSFLELNNLKLTISKKTLKAGDTYQIRTKPLSLSSDYALTYQSSKKSVAVVSRNGKVRAKKKGTALITVSSFHGKTVTLKIVVK